MKPVIDDLRDRLGEIVSEHDIENEPVHVKIGTLTVKQAIGSPERQDYPLLEGREVMIEAEVKGGFGQAFTDRPHEFTGALHDILSLDLNAIDNRAIFIATLNAVMASLNEVTGARHCHDQEPEECARELAAYLMTDCGQSNVGMIGLQPAILDHLVRVFGGDNVRCTDLNPANTGTRKYGAEIWDGHTDTDRLIAWSDVLLVTSSTIVNNSFDTIREKAAAINKRLIIFGVTGAGASAMLDIERLCFQPH